MRDRVANLLLLLVPICLAGCVSANKDLYPPADCRGTVLFVASCLTWPRLELEPTSDVYVVSNGWHAGLILNRSDVEADAWPELSDIPATEYVEVGWGNEGFYMAKHITPTLILGALVPSDSVLHVAGFSGDIESIFRGADLVRVEISKPGLAEMCRFIHATYLHDAGNQPVRLGPGLYGQSEFYRAHGKYYFPNTCNVWTANALRSAGCPITPAYASTAQNLVFQAKRLPTANAPPFQHRADARPAGTQQKPEVQPVSFTADVEKPR